MQNAANSRGFAVFLRCWAQDLSPDNRDEKGKGGSHSGPAGEVDLLEITWGVSMWELLRPMEKMRAGNVHHMEGRIHVRAFISATEFIQVIVQWDFKHEIAFVFPNTSFNCFLSQLTYQNFTVTLSY